MSGYKNIWIRATGQVTEMVPAVARELINSGIAEEVSAKPESMDVSAGERAVAPAQAGPTKKTLFSRGKSR